MRGKKELYCLNKIKQGVFPNYKNYFGLLEEDRNEIEQILSIVKPNVNANEFPDFIFKKGFIEHFQVSSSKTTRKGAEHIKEVNMYKSKVNKEIENFKYKCNNTPSFDEVRSQHWSMKNPEHSHGFLIKSFKKNWQKHLESLDKYIGCKDIGIFMIEYSDIALTMIENVYKDWIDGMSQGDMSEPESFEYYRLSRDKELLKFMYDYREKIKYVIFVNYHGYEILRLENIPYLLKLLPYEYVIVPAQIKIIDSVYSKSKKT